MVESDNIGFLPERLIEAKEVRCMSAIMLSDIIGVSDTEIYQYQKGMAIPSPETLTLLAKALNVPESYFFKET